MSKIITNEALMEDANVLTIDFDTFMEEFEEYELPTIENLDAGGYSSCIDRFEKAFDAKGTLLGIDCYHTLTDSNGNVKRVRFRIFHKGKVGTIKDLMKTLKDYGTTTFEEAVGVEEDVVISQKENSNYLVISSRKKKHKRTGGFLSSKRKPITVAPPDDDLDYDDFLPDDEED